MSYNRQRVARNFIKRYGRSKYRQLLQSFEKNDNGQQLADELNVSRERIRQWKNTFGEVVTTYNIHPDIQDLLKPHNPEQ